MKTIQLLTVAVITFAGSGIVGLPASSIVLSEQEVNANLLNAGFVPLGTQIFKP